ncbi:ABC transporter substrate-binding protein [Ignatzschineria rhizosphaerae]|uniref:ABC transporter substrate-binding protein n=1 Tax=Ignatzschineria rhizosphaerae TaxID=2923279 RepID=A0ABY3X425_9GAMM|nr:ABC transporter substrate-binding protein [Ignatzschineria rhizosphaerae]UNM95476.1 ABC transporter substrate-binding protein [Ignatzschineria rhizosphaerae]
MRQLLLAIGLTSCLGLAIAAPKGVVMDFGALDTIDALGGGEAVVAIPKQFAPEYLEKYQTETMKSSGDMFKLDMDLIAQENPDFIIISGRQGKSAAELQAIAPVINFSAANDDFLESAKFNIFAVGNAIEKRPEAEAAWNTLSTKFEKSAEKAKASAQKALVLMHNDGNFWISNNSGYATFVHDVLGVKRAETEEVEKGAQADAAYLTSKNPDIIYIIDRSAAIGQPAMDQEYFKAADMAQINAIKNDKVIYLTPKLWYLSGKGLQSLDLQTDEIMKAID